MLKLKAEEYDECPINPDTYGDHSEHSHFIVLNYHVKGGDPTIFQACDKHLIDYMGGSGFVCMRKFVFDAMSEIPNVAAFGFLEGYIKLK